MTDQFNHVFEKGSAYGALFVFPKSRHYYGVFLQNFFNEIVFFFHNFIEKAGDRRLLQKISVWIRQGEEMTRYCRKRLGSFIENYFDLKDKRYSFIDEIVIKECVADLIRCEIFTPSELQKEILRDCSVLLPMKDIMV